jgi:hypothetical protein
MAYSVRYEFSQKFEVPAREAYEWCTSYDPNDLALIGEVGTRSISAISESTVILNDTYKVGKTINRRKRLVQLYPAELFWVSTHLIGPTKYSQFLYKISPETKSRSRLDFTGLQIEYGSAQHTKQSITARSEKLRKIDSEDWKKLAEEMEHDWRKNPSKI